jgi:hypothetical protein
VEIYKCDNTSTISNNIGFVNGRLRLSQSGEGVIAYYGDNEREPTAFLAAISSNTGEIQGTGLVYDETAVDIGKTPISQYYSGARNDQSEWSDYLPLVNNAVNWSETGGNIESYGDSTQFTRKTGGSIMLVK